MPGIEPGPPGLRHRRHALLMVKDKRSTSAHPKIGVTNRIRTGTNAFTGRDAAVTS